MQLLFPNRSRFRPLISQLTFSAAPVDRGWTAKLSLMLSSIDQRPIDNLFVETKRNQSVVAARISGDFHSTVFFRFPALSRSPARFVRSPVAR